ncbi:MAG: single-stranded DNA-binding protein [Clostridia bacterium]|nr:single-stranded DNA-binding protein [Clostridia bacterium]
MANFNLNKAILGGRLTADPELKQTPQGVPVVSFSIAVNRKGKDASTDFINCVAWRQTADFICRFFKKGSSICVSGSIQTRNWTDNQNNKRQATEVVVDEAFFVDTKGENSQGGFDEPAAFQTTQAPKFEEVASDDELPF